MRAGTLIVRSVAKTFFWFTVIALKFQFTCLTLNNKIYIYSSLSSDFKTVSLPFYFQTLDWYAYRVEPIW